MNTDFSAAAPALGYLHQARYALNLLLDGTEEAALSIERFDDVSFEKDGTPQELIQLKHHSKPASLGNTSTELWKTLRIWCTYLDEGKIKLPETMLTLVTTAIASENSVASQLRPGKSRDASAISAKLLDIINKSDSKTLKPAFDAFKKISPKDRSLLINSIQVIDQSVNIVDTSALIKRKLIGVRKEYISSLYERLEGWWFNRVIHHLSSEANDTITRYEVQEKIADIAEQFRSDNLPIDFLDSVIPEETKGNYDRRLFVIQLRTIALSNQRIEKAILDYYRAFEQRGKWAREDLLINDEVRKYEKKLVDEWERLCDRYINEHKIVDEEDYKNIGKKIFYWMDHDADIPIRPMVTEPYVMRGSFHILADEQPPKVWWHPQFIDRLEALLTASEG